MVARKRGLGRGLDALLSGSEPEAQAVSAEDSANGGLRELPVELIQRGKYQPRIDMHTETLQELADSIKAQGVVQPIVVRPIDSEHAEQHYEIIAGERRWRAAQLAGLQNIPTVVRAIPDRAAIAVALIENIQRENLNPLEEALALQRLIDEFEMTHQQAAEAVGRSRTSVTNLLRLLELADEVKSLVEQKQLDMGHARALLALPKAQQAPLAAEVVAKQLTVRETEKRVRSLNQPQAEPAAEDEVGEDPDVLRLQKSLSDTLGAEVSIRHGRKGNGKLTIQYHSLDELDGILGRIR